MSDPLPSWNDCAAKRSLIAFVAAVSKEGGADFVPAHERIACFDNDGTLWCEQPMQAQVFFTQASLEEKAAADPSLRERQPYKAFLDHDMKTIHALGKEGVFEVAFAVHSGMTIPAFEKIASAWLSTARHPETGRRFLDMVYRPQIELIAFLQAKEFRTFIVTGGGADFVRAFAETSYGVARENVIGSTVTTEVQYSGAACELMKRAELQSFNDRDAKVENIGLHIGRRPILAFGNSDGDLAMLRYALAGKGRRLGLILHHDDAEREFAYDREFRLSPLAEALDDMAEYGISLVSMKRDWKRVFADASAPQRTA